MTGWDDFIARMDADIVAKVYADICPVPVKPPPPFLFRPQRAFLAEAMAEVKEFDGTWAALQGLVEGAYGRPWPPGARYGLHAVKPYGGVDKRIGWDTYIVTATFKGGDIGEDVPFVVGFTNGPVVSPEEPTEVPPTPDK